MLEQLELNDVERKVLYALDERVSLDEVQVASEALVPPGETLQVLVRLEERGLVRVVRGRHGRHYLRRR